MSDDELPLSAVALVLELREGEAYAKAVFIPATQFSPDRVKDEKRRLMHTLSSVIARAHAKRPNLALRIYTTHSFTNSYDVVVAGLIVQQEEEL
jgi:hypothetical protein